MNRQVRILSPVILACNSGFSEDRSPSKLNSHPQLRDKVRAREGLTKVDANLIKWRLVLTIPNTTVTAQTHTPISKTKGHVDDVRTMKLAARSMLAGTEVMVRSRFLVPLL